MKRWRSLCTAMTLLLAAALVSPAPKPALAQDFAYQEDFEDGQAQGWSLEPGWQVSSDGGNQVLVGTNHVWARADQTFDGDLRQSFRLKLLQGRIHLVVRLTDAARYFIGFDSSGSDLNKQYFPEEFHHGLAQRDEAHSLDRWYQLEIVMKGSTVALLVDGAQQWSYTDSQPLTGGSLAFETLDGSLAHVDDIAVSLGAAPRPAPQLAPTVAPPLPEVAPTLAAPPPAGSLNWVRTGGPLGGLGYDIRMRPDNPDIMYVTDAKAGVFKSTDGGRTWVPKTNGITARVGTASDEIPVFCLTIDPGNYDTLWAGTQWQRGFFKSTDGAESWKKMDNGVVERGLTTRGFGVDPNSSDVVYAAGEVSSWEWAGRQINGREFDLTKGVVYKTTNGGTSWRKVWEGDNLARYVWIDPRDSNVVYVSTGIFDREAANSDVLNGIQGGVGILKSTDGGTTWQQINNGLRNLYVGSLFMHPANPDILLAGTGTAWSSGGSGVYLTTDGGASWKQTLEVDPMIEAVEFSATNPQIAYAGGFGGVYRSQDGGLTWKMTMGPNGWGSPGIMAGHPFDFQVDPRDPDRVFSNQYSGGNFLSLDGGLTWESASKGYSGAAIRDLVVDPTQPGRVIVAARSGIFGTYNGGDDWMGLSFSPYYFPDWHVVAMDPSNSQHVIAGMTCWRNLVASTNGGMTWNETYSFVEGEQKAFAAVAFAPSAPKTVYAASAGFISCGHITSDVPSSGFNATMRKPGAGVFISHDGGEHWQPSPDPQMQDLSISELAVNQSDPNLVFASTFYHGLFRSSDGGQTWTQVGGGLPPDQSITVVRIDPHHPNTVYAGRNQGGLYRSTDGGSTWRRVAAGLPAEGVITDVAFDPLNPQVLYAAEVFSGIYRSTDGGKSWTLINTGLLARSFNALGISNDGLHLYAASEGSGVYRLDLSGRPPERVAPPQPAASPTKAASAGTAPSPTSVAQPGGPGGLPLPSCTNALLPLGLIVAVLWQRRRGPKGAR